MFGNGKTIAAVSGGNGALSVIGSDVTVRGDLVTEGNLHVDGAVEGDISCGSLVQGAQGRITGAVRARVARIAGTVEGSVSAGKLSVERTARIDGDVSYEALSVDEGALLSGRLSHAGTSVEPNLHLVGDSATG